MFSPALDIVESFFVNKTISLVLIDPNLSKKDNEEELLSLSLTFFLLDFTSFIAVMIIFFCLRR